MEFSQAVVLPLEASFLHVSKGCTAKVLAEAEQGIPTPLIAEVANGTVWHETALFIDHAQGSNLPKASPEGLGTL